MAGRGRGLLQSLKEKKEEKPPETAQQAPVSPPRSRLTSEAPEETKPVSPQIQRKVITKLYLFLLNYFNINIILAYG